MATVRVLLWKVHSVLGDQVGVRALLKNTVSATIPIFVNEISSPPSHLHLDQTDNFPQMLYSNLKMAELGRNM